MSLWIMLTYSSEQRIFTLLTSLISRIKDDIIPHQVQFMFSVVWWRLLNGLDVSKFLMGSTCIVCTYHLLVKREHWLHVVVGALFPLLMVFPFMI